MGADEQRELKEVAYEKVYKMGEVLELIGVPKGTLRDWVKYFGEYLQIQRNKQNHQLFNEWHIEVFEKIKEGREQGHSLRTIEIGLVKAGYFTREISSMAIMTPEQTLVMEQIQGIGDYIKELEARFEEKLEEKLRDQEQKIREQIKVENQRLMDYIEEKRQEKKGFWNRIFKK